MALNPNLFPNGMPVPFTNELFVLARDGVEFEIDKIPGSVPYLLISFSIPITRPTIIIEVGGKFSGCLIHKIVSY